MHPGARGPFCSGLHPHACIVQALLYTWMHALPLHRPMPVITRSWAATFCILVVALSLAAFTLHREQQLIHLETTHAS